MTATSRRVDDQAYFDDLVSWISGQLQGSEVILATLVGERSEFIRFNNADVRQAGSVIQTRLELDLIEEPRHTQGSIQLARDVEVDRARVSRLVDVLRAQRRSVPDDPFLLFNTVPASSESVRRDALPTSEDVLAAIRR